MRRALIYFSTYVSIRAPPPPQNAAVLSVSRYGEMQFQTPGFATILVMSVPIILAVVALR